jgi:hypothetical protein
MLQRRARSPIGACRDRCPSPTKEEFVEKAYEVLSGAYDDSFDWEAPVLEPHAN